MLLTCVILLALVPPHDVCKRNYETTRVYCDYSQTDEAAFRGVVWSSLLMTYEAPHFRRNLKWAVWGMNLCTINEPRVGIWPAPVPVERISR